MADSLDERMAALRRTMQIPAAAVAAGGVKRRATSTLSGAPPPAAPVLLDVDEDDDAPPAGQYTVTADPAIIGVIGRDSNFELLAPFFPTADGPSVTAPAGTNTITLEWKWQPESTQAPSEYKDAPPYEFLELFGAQGGGLMTPTSTITATLRLPRPFLLGDKVKASTRRPGQHWGRWTYATNRSACQGDIVVRPRERIQGGDQKA